MLIYKHNLHEKLFGSAISREYIKYQTPFCDLLDHPDLKLDFDLAINFNQALNGNLKSRENFTNMIMLCSSEMDVPTQDFYRQKMQTYPIFASEIDRMNFIFNNYNKLPNTDFISQFKAAMNDCLTAPCNIFKPNSTSVGKLAQGTLFANVNTIFPVGELKDAYATFTGGVDHALFNKIPKAFQKSLVNMGVISKNASAEAHCVLTINCPPGRSQAELIANAKAGISCRRNTKGYRHTPDLKSFLDLSKVAADLLGGIASDMGDCFRRYQHSLRYNPYDASQNLSTVAKSPQVDSVNCVPFLKTAFGQTVSNTGGNAYNNLSPGGPGNAQRPGPITNNNNSSSVINITPASASAANGERVVVYSSWLDEKTFYSDPNPTKIPSTEVGATAIPTVFVGPNSWDEYKKKATDEKYTANKDLTKILPTTFTNGFAISLKTLARYFSGKYNEAALLQIMQNPGNQSTNWIYATIKKSGGSDIIVQIVDTCEEENTFKLTPYTYTKIFGKLEQETGNAGSDVNYDENKLFRYNRTPVVTCSIVFTVGKLPSVSSVGPGGSRGVSGAGTGGGGAGSGKGAVDPEEIRKYFISKIPDSKLNGLIPKDGSNYGIISGTPEEWAAFFVRLCKLESSYNNFTTGDEGRFESGSHGLFQLSVGDAVNYKLNGGQKFTLEQLQDPYVNMDATIHIAGKLVSKCGYIKLQNGSSWGGVAAYWGPVRRKDTI